MSKHSLSRRGLLVAGATVAASAASTPLAAALQPERGALGPEALRLISEIKDCATRLREAETLEMHLESHKKRRQGLRRYRAAVRDLKMRETAMNELTERILGKPVLSWDDVAVRAELARVRVPGMLGGGFCIVEEPTDPGEEALGGLLVAALTMAGRPLTVLP